MVVILLQMLSFVMKGKRKREMVAYVFWGRNACGFMAKVALAWLTHVNFQGLKTNYQWHLFILYSCAALILNNFKLIFRFWALLLLSTNYKQLIALERS